MGSLCGRCWVLSPGGASENWDVGKIAPSPVLGRVGGAYFGVVVANGRNGLVMRRASRYRRAQSGLQKEAAERMRRVSAVWPELSPEAVAAWEDYARTLQRRDRLTGEVYSPTGFNTFVGLACKVLQVDPMAEIPASPPVGVFLGDSLRVTAAGVPSPLPPPQAWGGGEGKEWRPCGPSSLHPLQAWGGGAVRWTADAANATGTVTELLWEKLANRNRKPTGRWKTAGFHAFAPGALSVDVPAAPGWYLVGFRYVEAATGRVVGGWRVGVVEVV